MAKKRYSTKLDQHDITLALTEAIANIPNPPALFQVIYETLRPIFRFALTGVILPTDDPELGTLYLHAFSMPDELKSMAARKEFYIRDALSGFDPESPEIIQFDVSEIHRQEVGLAEELEIMEKALGISQFTLCPLVHRGKIVGHWILGNVAKSPIGSSKIPLLQQVGRILAGAVSSTTAYASLADREQQARRQLAFASALLAARDSVDFARTLLDSLCHLGAFALACIEGLDENPGPCCWYQLVHGSWLAFMEEPFPATTPSGSASSPFSLREFDANDLAQLNWPTARHLDIQSALRIAISADSRQLVVTLCTTSTHTSPLPEATLLEQAAPQICLSFQNRAMWQEVQELQARLQQENRTLLDEFAPSGLHQGMLGRSSVFRMALERARLVSASDTSVLLLGETGTGKEMMARFIHENSPRHDKPLIRVNCAALPAQLIESELFGHEKGSFTGAIEKRLGKFELAHGGTLFLDEIGELPLESQAKLLRVLQEKEFERVGGQQVLKSDVRVIAATNRDLAEEARNGKFRSDLYYRLGVFPLTMPPLRERSDDIALLAEHFLRKAAKKLGRQMQALERSDIEALTRYAWPGNIRELEHVLENAAILAQGNRPNLRDFRNMAEHRDAPDDESGQELPPWDDMCRQHILRALQVCKGRIGGAQGAAARLGLNEKTLGSKMRKLGIRRHVDYA